MANLLQVALVLGGQINPSLSRSFNFVSGRLSRLQGQAVATTATMSRIGRGAGGLLALGGLVAGMASITGFMSKSVELAKQQMNYTGNLQVLLENQHRIRGQNVSLATEEVQAIERQAKALQEQTGIYKTIYIQGAAILATAHLNAAQIEQMQPMIANLLVYQRRMGREASSLQDVYQAIAKSITTGMARGLNQIGIQLDPWTRKILTINATAGHAADNIAILARALRLFAGESTGYLRTMLGQVDLAMSHIQEWQARIGTSFIPVQQQLVILFGRVVSIFGPYVESLLKNLAGWMEILNKNLARQMPVIKQIVAQGWQKFVYAINWIKQNGAWLLPWLAKIGMFLVGWKTAIVALRLALIPLLLPIRLLLQSVALVTATNPWVLLALAVAGAATMIILNWKKVQDFFETFWMRAFGGQRVGENVRRSIPAFGIPTEAERHRGVLPGRAVQPGQLVGVPFKSSWGYQVREGAKMMGRIVMIEVVHASSQIMSWIMNQMTAMLGGYGKRGWLSDMVAQFWGYIVTWIQQKWIELMGWFANKIQPIRTGFDNWIGALQQNMQNIQGWIQTFITDPLQGALNLWQQLFGGSAQAAPSPGQRTYRPPEDIPGYSKTYEQYPWEGRSSNFGPTGAYLGVPNEIGIGPLRQAMLGVRPGRNDWVLTQFTDGTRMWRKVMETSAAPGGMGIEFWSPQRGLYERHGRVKIIGVSHGTPGEETRRETATVHVHNNVTYNVQGGEEGYHRIAELHRRHIDQLKRDIAEVMWRNRRGSFVNSPELA